MDFVQLAVHGLHLISSYAHITQQWACPHPTQDMSCYSSQACNYDSLTWAIYSIGHQLGWPSRWLLHFIHWDVELFPTARRRYAAFCSSLLNLAKQNMFHLFKETESSSSSYQWILHPFDSIEFKCLSRSCSKLICLRSSTVFTKNVPNKIYSNIKRQSTAIVSLWQNYKQPPPIPHF